MPAIDILIDNAPKPILLEINGGILPTSVQPVIKSVAFEGNSRGPSVQSVVDVLQTRGIVVDAQKMEVSEWMNSSCFPCFLLPRKCVERSVFPSHSPYGFFCHPSPG